jgi:N,N'-diacetyllegionaminate synthase
VRPTSVALGNRTVGEGGPCFVLAAMASAHGGSVQTALRMIEAAFTMGADGVLAEVFRADLLLARRHPDRREYERLELAPADWRRILRSARASGLAVVATVFDSASLDLAVEEEVHALAIHATDAENPAMLRAVASAGRPLLLAPGGLPESAVRRALDLLGAAPVVLVHGPAAAPTSVEELRLARIAQWKERFRVPVGLLDHTDGGSAFAHLSPALAAAVGADLVAKRFTLDRSLKGPDYESAVSPEDFYRTVELLRQAERALGDGASGESEEAERQRRSLSRSIVAASLIGRGEVVTASMLAFKRTDPRLGGSLGPGEADRVIGRRAVRPIQADEMLRDDMFE